MSAEIIDFPGRSRLPTERIENAICALPEVLAAAIGADATAAHIEGARRVLALVLTSLPERTGP